MVNSAMQIRDILVEDPAEPRFFFRRRRSIDRGQLDYANPSGKKNDNSSSRDEIRGDAVGPISAQDPPRSGTTYPSCCLAAGHRTGRDEKDDATISSVEVSIEMQQRERERERKC